MPPTIVPIRDTASLIVPEIILLATACALFLVGPFMVSDTGDKARRLRHRWGFVSLIGLAIAWMVWFSSGSETAAGTLFRIDSLVWFTRGLSLTAGILLVLVMWHQVDDSHSAESHACLLAILAGTSLVAASNDLVAMFLSLELVSIPTYVILYLPRRDRIGNEAALKYFLLSVFSSALVLYGMSWLYGVIGTTNFDAIKDVLFHRNQDFGERLLQITFALLLAGLCFRIAAVPFHFYAPDVFQGTTAANAAFLSYVPKIVGFVALMRLIFLAAATEGRVEAHWEPEHSNKLLLGIIAVLTMFVGNLMALRQKHLYRLMAYSSIAHAGYMLIGLSVGYVLPVLPFGGQDALLFYLAVYGLMTIGTFALFSAVGGRACTTLDDLRGLARTQPSVALLLTICLFGLTGLPPTAGFLGKLNLFIAAWSDNTNVGYGLAIMLAINAAISAWYYLRLVALMYLEPAPPEESGPRPIVWAPWLAGAACALGTIVLFFSPQWLLDKAAPTLPPQPSNSVGYVEESEGSIAASADAN